MYCNIPLFKFMRYRHHCVGCFAKHTAICLVLLLLYTDFFYTECVFFGFQGLDCRHSDAAAGGFGPPHPCSIALSQQLYSSDIGCSSHAAIYHHHPLQPNTCPASAAGSSSASVLYHNSSRPPHFQHPHHPSQHHEGIFQPMPDHSNDVYHATPMTTNPALDAASATAQGPYHPSPSSGAIYSNGTKETMAALDEERHDLLDENQQRIFCVQ